MTNKKPLCFAVMLGLTGSVGAFAGELYQHDGTTLNLNVEGMAGVFSSQENYTGTAGSRQWQEGYLKAELAAERTLETTSLYGGLGVIALGTWGDGDAAGLTSGDEQDLKLENAYIGFKSNDGLIDLSIGRQGFTLGDGFIIAGDAISLGKIQGVDVNRGGAYYLAGQKSFDNTAILRLGPQGPVRGDLFWLKSSNPYHQNTELAGINAEWVDDAKGTLGLSYLHVLDVDAGSGLGLWDRREGMDVLSLRGQGSLGVENLFLSFEYVKQQGGDTATENAGTGWYVEGGWTFADLPWTPTLNYRHAQFSGDKNSTTDKNEAFDPLFFGFTRGFGTWFQGEVASNYAGPANSGNRVDRLELQLQPRENLTLGAQYWHFGHKGDGSDLSGQELDLYALWSINDNWVFSPLIGIYKPDGDAVRTNQGNNDNNLYLQAVMMYFF